MNFFERCQLASNDNQSHLCVGLDPDFKKLPQVLKTSKTPLFDFCRTIVDQTHDLVCAFKPQIAYFSAQGAEPELEKLISYIQTTYPKIPVLLDAKRGDIGATSEKYAEEAFERYHADAVTLNPYMGTDSLQPFLNYKEKGIILLCKTSNSGSMDFQNLTLKNHPLFIEVAKKAANDWNENKNVGLVVGATFPEEMKEIRQVARDLPFLVPGLGAQGGSPEECIQVGRMKDQVGLIFSSSRAIIYASSQQDFGEAARKAADENRKRINQAKN